MIYLGSLYNRMFTKVRTIRYKLYALKYKLILKKSYLDLELWSKPTIYYPENLSIGKGVSINDYFWVDARGGVEIGNNVLIGPDVKIITVNHRFGNKSKLIRKQGNEIQEVVVGDDVWLAAGVTLLPGVHVGRGSVVAAGAVVTKNLKPYSVVGGIPARQIKIRKNN